MPEQAEIEAFQALFEGQINSNTPSAVVRHTGNHYFVVVFDHQACRTVTFGQSIGGDDPGVIQDDWELWGGPHLWDKVAALHGWDPTPRPVVHEAINWKQNGIDCGTEAASVLQYLLSHGLPSREQLEIPPRHCSHQIRQLMLNTACQIIYRSYQWYRTNHGIPEALVDGFRDILESGWDQWPLIGNLGHKLTRANVQCQECQHSARQEFTLQNHHSEEQESLSDDGAFSTESDLGPLEGVVAPQPRQAHATRIRKAHHPATFTIPLQVAAFKEILSSLRSTSNYFDDYFSGPVQEDNATIPLAIRNFPDNPYAQRIYSSHWTMFRDYGYRIFPSFYQMFNQGPPQLLLEHILPVPPPIFEPQPTPEAKSEPKPAAMSLGELLVKASTGASRIDYLLCGRSPHNHKELIAIDPLLDGIEDVNVSISVDIDSVIWVTHRLHFKLGAKLKMGSTHGQEAPISRNNHVTVTLLQPPSEDDREVNGGQRQEWVSTRHGLHTLPHMRFVQCGEGSGSFNAYIFFPRMKHKSEYGNRSVSIIPTVVQDLFFAQVLLPALKAVSRVSGQSYLVQTIEQLKYMMGTTGKPISIPLGPEQMAELQKSMEEQINSDSDLAIFGSFFFVVDARGIKLWTVDGAQVAPDPLTALQVQTPSLDWDYMLNRRNGELLLDLGIAFHPTPSQDQALNSQSEVGPLETHDGVVGLGKLDFLRRSYAMAGFKGPAVYRSCTLADFGNLQAEMSSTRRRGTHISFRQTYNLAYEVIRRPGKQFTVCSEADAYRGKQPFVQSVNAVLSQLRDSNGKSYGVREELRIGGGALTTVLSSVLAKATEYLAAKPILWISSRTWFTLLEQRVIAIRDAQVQMSKKPGENHGTITGIMMHLLRCVMVNPQYVPDFVKDNLRNIRFEETISGHGAFFAHSLQLEIGYLSDIDAKDNDKVRTFMGLKKGAGQRKQRTMSSNVVENISSPDLPLGAQPSWEKIGNILAVNPQRFLNPYVYKEDHNIGSNAKELFIKFTSQVWFGMKDAFLTVNNFNNTITRSKLI
ncbi:hypothetical protein FRC01_003117 [Tulasnella sp. 417]|nr:hypothetical protein FRC01_003117 [Tulasnella sp. 417]